MAHGEVFPRGRDQPDLSTTLETPGWSNCRVEEAMRAIKYGDQIASFRAKISRFRAGDLDRDVRNSTFDVAFCHRVLDTG
nr:hypothetical protein [Rhodococcus sp. (in: high G+C Gram-positive bacteria)]